jgi:hypothetical protein
VKSENPLPEWIEPISKEQARSGKQLPVLPLDWRATTVPKVPVTLPIPALLNITAEAIQVHAERKNEEFYEDEEFDLHFPKQDIVSVDIFLMPPIEDYMRHVELTEYSRAVIRHRDLYEVVPYFESTFTCENHYWLRALAKALKDRLGVKQTFCEVGGIAAPQP